ncbi:two-component sensor histidine kinase [Enemella evansiae]|uniref:sensor histidine kinase n=1 Tax=Enemella evansiae TaxID=2016499 RepID=UPI000B962788|nr:sensor histidine kinase [Enemella evansiae]OYO07046.1 two-component sensor histidine kinase [Enemella evansiae]
MSISAIHDWGVRHRWVVDLGWALLAAPVFLVSAIAIDRGPTPGIWYALWGLLFALPIVFRRIRPDLAAGLAVVPHVIQLIISNEPQFGNAVVPIVLHSVAARSTLRWARVWLAVALLGAVAAAVDWSRGIPGAEAWIVRAVIFGSAAALALVGWFAGLLARAQIRSHQALRERTEALEREREQGIRLAASEERSRIAREMHDLVAHSLSVVVVQTDGAHYLVTSDADPQTRLAAAERALTVIGDTARTALNDTRRLVGVLREPGRAELEPGARLDELPDLIASVRTAGLPVELTITGEPPAANQRDEAAELAAYRIVQEALTNVLRHAGPARAEVRLSHPKNALEVEILDDGTGSTPTQAEKPVIGGNGLVGMRERVAAFDGELETGNRPEGGYRVWARIELPRRKVGRDDG